MKNNNTNNNEKDKVLWAFAQKIKEIFECRTPFGEEKAFDEFIYELNAFLEGANEAQMNIILEPFYGWEQVGDETYHASLKVVQQYYYLEVEKPDGKVYYDCDIEQLGECFQLNMPSTREVMDALETAYTLPKKLFYKIA